MRYLFIFTLLLLYLPPALAERYEYYAEVNQVIPDFDSVGIADTIFVPIHAVISRGGMLIGLAGHATPSRN